MEYIQDNDYEVAERNGICKGTVYSRVNVSNWSIQDAITVPVLGKDPERNKWKNIAAENGINTQLFNSRVAEGWPYERAATEPRHTRDSITKNAIKANLKVFTPEQVEIMKANGIKHSTAYGRVYRYGWKVEDAIVVPPGGKNPNKKYKRMLLW